MVTFNCEVCNATVPKKNTEKHYSRCPEAYYTCIDCSTTFDDGYSYKQHTQCVSEDEKYQKALYQGKKKKPAKQPAKPPAKPPAKVAKPRDEQRSAPPAFKAGTSLYKALKGVKDKDAKKKLLKSLVCDSNGHWVLDH